jgi:hypothetical protein
MECDYPHLNHNLVRVYIKCDYPHLNHNSLMSQNKMVTKSVIIKVVYCAF